MDNDRFDALARLLGAAGTRRGTLSALLGAAFLGAAPEVEAGGEDHEKRRRRNRRRDNDRDKKKKKRKKKDKPPPPPPPCPGTGSCAFPAPGLDFENCNLVERIIPDCSGCNFRAANLHSADLSFSDVSGASFRNACLVGANFFKADTDGAHFGGAIFCNTITPDGQTNDSGCHLVNDCCPSCLGEGQSCGGGGPAGCCELECVEGICAQECVKDADCTFDVFQFCCDGVCVEECCEDFQCPSGFCVGGECVECLKDNDCGGDAPFCCDNTCTEECCFGSQCPFGFCVEGECVECIDTSDCLTKDPTTCCNNFCVDTETDPENCGECDEGCISGVCVGGECEENGVT
jgi:hypothetical protein